MPNNTGLEWLEENGLRAYPLISNSTQYITYNGITYDMFAIIVDALILTTNTNPVQITQLNTTSSDLYITITGGIQFILSNFINAIYPQYLRDTTSGVDGNLLVLGPAAALLPLSATIPITNTIFEASVVNVIPSILGLSSLTISTLTNLTGNITLNEGTQVSLIPGNQIEIEVGRGYGIPLGCQDNFLDQFTPDCINACSYVNGVSPSKTGNPIFIVGGNHISVYDDPDNNRIFIGYDFDESDIPAQQLPSPPRL